MGAQPGVGWSSYADQPLDAAQRDALVLARVGAEPKGTAAWRLPEDWDRAWITAAPPGSAYGADTVRKVWLDGVDPWFAPAPAWARPTRSRRPPRGSGLALCVADQVSLWRRGYPLAVRGTDEGADALAIRHGPRLGELPEVPGWVRDLGWRTPALPGWSVGGPLHLDCPKHGEPLQHWRCDHAAAITMKRRFLACCPRCDERPAARLGTRLRRLMDARAALDAELATPAPAGATHRVYVVEAIGDDGATDLYVGQTSGTVEERIEVHRDGGAGAARIFRKAATVGDPRPDLLPEEWVLPTRSAALAAEAFTHLLIEARNPGIRVHGDTGLAGARPNARRRSVPMRGPAAAPTD